MTLIENSKELEQLFTNAVAVIEKLKEPLEDLVKIKDFLKTVKVADLIAKENEEFTKKVVFGDLTTKLIKRLVRERSSDPAYLEAVADVLEGYLIVFLELLKVKHFNQKFYDSVKLIFDYSGILHKYHYQIDNEELKRLRTVQQAWRKDLKQGDKVDALVVADEKGRLTGWLQAVIEHVDGDTLSLVFPDSASGYDKTYNRWSTEVAVFESRTKERYAWAKEHIKVDQEYDCHDKSGWYKSTVLAVKKHTISQDRVIDVALVGFRVYKETGSSYRKDERGYYEGWSSKFDDWIPFCSPRIYPLGTRVNKLDYEEGDDDEQLDDLINPEEGFDRVYAVPRPLKCASSKYLHMINMFGHMKGFDMIIDLLQNESVSEEEGKMTVGILNALTQCISAPAPIYHQQYANEIGPKVADTVFKKILSASDKSLRDIRKEDFDGIVKGIDSLKKRYVEKSKRELENETLKLQLCIKFLDSTYLERRIQAIRELNSIIKNNMWSMNQNQTVNSKFLIQWMEENQVFQIMWDQRRTHLQIVQRTNEVFKLLLKEDMLSDKLLELFWSLSRTEYKAEVYKIVNESSFYLKQNHIVYLFDQITQQPPEKFSMTEFECMSELGKYCKDSQFQNKVSQFFWKIIVDSEQYKEELINNCTKKFCEMIRFWYLKQKIPYMSELNENLKDSKKVALPMLQVLRTIIADERSRTVSYSTSTTAAAGGSAEEVDESNKEMTIDEFLNSLYLDNHLIDNLLANLTQYFKSFAAAYEANKDSITSEDPEKISLVQSKYSHSKEVDERLSFLKYFAASSEFEINKVHLKTIYDLFANSPLKSDLGRFLVWCKNACESQSSLSKILDLNEVGSFFTELMDNKTLDVSTLPMVGFDFLSHYFISVNQSSQKLLKVAEEVKETKTNWRSNYFRLNVLDDSEVEDEEKSDTNFKVTTNPDELEHLGMVWNLVLDCNNSEVVPKAVKFLIKCYMSLSDDLLERKGEIQQSLINHCIKLLKETNEENKIKRIILIINHIISESELKGTGDVQPHNGILKGECLERVIIKNRTGSKSGNNLVVRLYTSATFWEFKKLVSAMLDLSPKYIAFKLSDGRDLSASDHGLIMEQLGIKNGDVITARKVKVVENIPQAPILINGEFSPAANKIFNEWFDLYKDPKEDEAMTPESTVGFIKGATGETIDSTDGRIKGMFQQYNKTKDGKLKRHEFLQFYLDASRSGREDRVRENIKQHGIRPDLKKLSEIQEEASFTKEQMPRFTLSKNKDHFNEFVNILDRNDSASIDAWELIRKLATNQELQASVLRFEQESPENSKIDWDKFFDNSSVFRLIYKLEIMEAFIEEDENFNLSRVELVEKQDAYSSYTGTTGVIVSNETGTNLYVNPSAPPPPGAKKAQQAEEKVEETVQKVQEEPEQEPAQIQTAEEIETEQLKNQWTMTFLQNKGFEYILQQYLNVNIDSESQNDLNQQFQLKHTAFMLKVVRKFLMAAFSTTDVSVYEIGKLARRSSSTYDEATAETDASKKTQEALQKTLEGPLAEEIIESIDYSKLQTKILSMIVQVLQKKEQSIEDKLIIETSLNLWIGCVMHKAELFKGFLEFESNSEIKNTSELILSGLLYSQEDKIREDFKATLSALCLGFKAQSESQSPIEFILPLMSHNFDKISEYPCKQYFALFNELIDYHFKSQALGQATNTSFDPEQLLSKIIDKIRADKAAAKQLDQNKLEEQMDDALAEQIAEERELLQDGLIKLTAKIIGTVDKSLSEKIVQEKDLINEIFKEFLFASVFDNQSANQNNKLKIVQKKMVTKSKKQSSTSSQSRESAYKLLNSLIMKSPLLMDKFLKNQLIPLMDLIKKPKGWNYTPPNTTEQKQKFVGLKNLGCICYMNSMMQQFYMIPAFRYNLLCVEDGVPEDIKEYKGEKIDDNMLHQMQKLIAHLELSQRMDYNPMEFCFAFKEFDGSPTITSEQKDAQEFLNVLFDRLENQLKPTPCKYLLQSIFKGQTCSQMVCQECGKIKNRIEDYYNLSLTVKDIKGVYESLQTQVDGEVINDYKCDGCDKKVDVSKRNLITETPNVLIVHLQRITFNMDTFRNDKINQLFDFPYMLDLKPYSYYDVMAREERLPGDKEGESDEESNANAQAEQNNKDGKAEEEDEPLVIPEQEDCFEYKLVGVNVHSGSANAGHYWSYINTRRGQDELDGSDPQWELTEKDTWMEFNDSRVSDYNFNKLKSECSGGDEGGSSMSTGWGWGASSGGYGKSGYMLFYERRKKKPLKILVHEDKVESVKESGVEVHYDEENKEHFKFIDYKDGVSDEAPNKIYSQVYEDNAKFSFENDIYSQEFFNFIKEILVNIASFAPDNNINLTEVKESGMKICKKVVIDILSRCFNNSGIKEMVEIMISIFETDDQLVVNFMKGLMSQNNAECILEVLLDCTDTTSRQNVGNLTKYLLSKLKMIEKDDLLKTEEYEEEVIGDDGKVMDKIKMTRPVAVCAQFVNHCLSLLQTRVAKAWSRFDQFLDMLYGFAIGAPEQTKNNVYTQPDFDVDGEAARLGIEFCYKINMIEQIGDFILGEKSPLYKPGQKRQQMGGSYNKPNFAKIMKLLTVLMSNSEFQEKYPLSAEANKMMTNQEILNELLASAEDNKHFVENLTEMCKNNEKLSKKIAKVFLKQISSTNVDSKVAKYFKMLKKFVKINDDLKLHRMQWVFGIGQVVTKAQYRTNKVEYGLELVSSINEEANNYITPLSPSFCDEALLAQLLRCRGKMDSSCIKSLKDLLSLCAKDDDVAKFIYNTAPPTYQYSRFSDWFRGYLEHQMAEVNSKNLQQYSYYANRLPGLKKALAHLEVYEEKCKAFAEQDLKNKESVKDDEFQGMKDSWMAYEHEDVIKHFPPQYIIGKQDGEDKVVDLNDENELVSISLDEVQNEFMFSNPTGMFNLSVPERKMRASNYETYSYEQYKRMQLQVKKQKEAQEQAKESDENANNEDKEGSEEQPQQQAVIQVTDEELNLRVKDWAEQRKLVPLVLKVVVQNKASETVKVKIELTPEDEETVNTVVPKPAISFQLYQKQSKQLLYLTKIDPSKPFGKINARVVKATKAQAPTSMSSTGTTTVIDTGVSTAYDYSVF